MRRAGRLFRASVLAVGLLGRSTAALPCGYEDPTSASSARGILNWVYPNALHVATAVWSGQQQGIIGRDEQPAATKALLGYNKAVERLGVFRDRLFAAAEGAAPAFSMVLIGPMLWTRYELVGDTLSMTPHVSGPVNGDVVIVTDEPVVAALHEWRVTPKTAREFGLMRLYGSREAVQDVTSWLDRLSPGTSAKASSVSN